MSLLGSSQPRSASISHQTEGRRQTALWVMAETNEKQPTTFRPLLKASLSIELRAWAKMTFFNVIWEQESRFHPHRKHNILRTSCSCNVYMWTLKLIFAMLFWNRLLLVNNFRAESSYSLPALPKASLLLTVLKMSEKTKAHHFREIITPTSFDL